MTPGASPQFAYMTPWVLTSQFAYRPGGPPSVDSARYAADFDETRTMGSAASTLRSDDETLAVRFWAAGTGVSLWNRLAAALSQERSFDLSRNARLFAQLNLAIADATIACWEAKYHYVFWRPVTAIPLADTDGNAATEADPAWSPLLVTPAHPEYPSGHSTQSGAAAEVLARVFGYWIPVSLESDVISGAVRSFPSLAAALEEVKNARIFAGIHFRSACEDGQAIGRSVADDVLDNALQRVRGGGGGR